MKRGNVQRKVGDIMGGRALDLDIVVAHSNGIAEGIEQGREEGVKGIRYNGQWYRGFDEMCAKGMFAGEKLTAIYDEFYDVEVVG